MMRKHLLPIVLFTSFLFITAKGQVGINTPTPDATLDVNGNAIIRTASSVTGGNGYTALVRDNITGELKTDATIKSPINIYNSNGTLTGNRFVNTAGNYLSFANRTSNIGIGTATGEGRITISGSGRGSFSAYGGGSEIGMYSDDNGAAVLGVSVNSNNTIFNFGTMNNAPLNINAGGLSRIFITPTGNTRVGTTNPTEKLDINGNVKFSNALMPNNVPGTTGQILVSNGAGAAPTWNTANTVSGTIASANYVQGTTTLNINQGSTADVPGVTITLNVPTGTTQTFLFTILGYAINTTSSTGQATQGVFALLQNGTKISSAYTSTGDGGSLVNLPAPVTFLKSVTLPAGTYTFKVQYSAWAGNQRVNHVPSNYGGYNGDTEAMLTKMQVLVYNN